MKLFNIFFLFLFCSQLLAEEPYQLRKRNHTLGDNTEFFEKIQMARAIPERTARLKAYSDAFRLFENNHYFIPLYEEDVPVIARKELNLRKDRPYNYEEISLWGISWKESNG